MITGSLGFAFADTHAQHQITNTV